MLIGYMRVSKADGSQATDLQRDALVAAGVDPAHLYEDQASGKREDRPGLASSRGGGRPSEGRRWISVGLSWLFDLLDVELSARGKPRRA
eukprot:gene19175-22971_t